MNRPNNHFITDATSPYTFTYTQYGVQKSLTVHQSANEETWPGGALWDIGVLMAKLLVMVQSPSSTTKSQSQQTNKNLLPHPPTRLVEPGIWGSHSWKEKRILELGCGVGLTGLVAASLGARAVILTDLEEVIHHITRPNVARNQSCFTATGGPSKVLAQTLCWGNQTDEIMVAKLLDSIAPPFQNFSTTTKTTHSKRKKKGKNKPLGNSHSKRPSNSTHHHPTNQDSLTDLLKHSNREGIPDVILIGDVAYQHKPGASSHFDILVSTTLQFSDEHTIVIFGTRMRMPASSDLLDMFHEEFEDIVCPPIEAHEIDSAFHWESIGKKHNITIHIMRKKREKAKSDA